MCASWQLVADFGYLLNLVHNFNCKNHLFYVILKIQEFSFYLYGVWVLALDVLKKLLGLFVVFAVTVLFSACSNGSFDDSWAFKCGAEVIPAGVYKYYLHESYNKAVDILFESNSSLSDLCNQKIAELPFNEWVKRDAENSCKDLLALERMFKDEGILLTEGENSELNLSTETVFGSLAQEFGKISVNKDDVKRAYAECKMKYDKLFNYFYAPGGKNEVTNDELLEYYKGEYVSCSMLTKYVTVLHPGDGSSSERSLVPADDQFENSEKQMVDYVNFINSGKKSFVEVANLFKEKEQLVSDPVETETINLRNADVDENILAKLRSLEVGKADYVKVDDVFILLYKNDITKSLPNVFDVDVRKDILKNMKTDEFYEKISAIKETMSIVVNTKLVKWLVPTNIFKD